MRPAPALCARPWPAALLLGCLAVAPTAAQVSPASGPLGATVGDFLDKPIANGGLNLGRFAASAVLLALMAGLVLLIPQRAGEHPGSEGRIA